MPLSFSKSSFLPQLFAALAFLSSGLAVHAQTTLDLNARPASAAASEQVLPAQGVQAAPATQEPEPAGPRAVLEATQLSNDGDLWARIRRGFAMQNLETPLVQDRQQWYSARPDYFARMTERSRRYMFHIVEELERRNMPMELALLPFIESAFNPKAFSSAAASGIWQFIPSTGRAFSLKQNVFRDERNDVQHSTRAALDYLQKLYGMFGDWHLALAAYNWGEGSVGRAIKKNQAAGLGVGYLDLSMPDETRYYIPKLQAVKNIVALPEASGVRLPEIENRPYFQNVRINRDIDVALAARLAGISLDDFKALNPSAKKPVILAAGTPNLLLPWEKAQGFVNNLEQHRGPLASWTAWVAPATLKVADAAKRVGMSPEGLRSINGIPPRMMVKAGSTLLIPRGRNVEREVSEQQADNAQMSLQAEPIPLKRVTYKARAGETVASFAKRLRQNPAQVAQWNKLSASSKLSKGQSVVVYVKPKASAKGGKKAKGGKAVAKKRRR